MIVRESSVRRKPLKRNLNEGRVVFQNGKKYQYLKENEQSEEMVDKIVDLYNEILENCKEVGTANGALKGRTRILTKIDLSNEAYDLDILDQTVEMGEEQDPISVTIKKDGSIIFGDSNFIQHYIDANGINDYDKEFPFTAEAAITYKPNGAVEVLGTIRGIEKLTLGLLIQ